MPLGLSLACKRTHRGSRNGGVPYGPVELYLVGIEGDRPDPGTVGALVDLVNSGLVRLLDFVLVSKDDDGDVSVIEVEDTDALGFGGVQLAAVGITGDDDIVELAELIPPGTSAVVVAFELLYLRALSERLAASGGVVLSAERIPAPVVNAVFDLVEAEGE